MAAGAALGAVALLLAVLVVVAGPHLAFHYPGPRPVPRSPTIVSGREELAVHPLAPLVPMAVRLGSISRPIRPPEAALMARWLMAAPAQPYRSPARQAAASSELRGHLLSAVALAVLYQPTPPGRAVAALPVKRASPDRMALLGATQADQVAVAVAATQRVRQARPVAVAQAAQAATTHPA